MSSVTDSHAGRDSRGLPLQLRKRFCCFVDEDAKILRELRPTIEGCAAEVVDRFYEHLLLYEPLRALLSNPARVERLKLSQRQYLISLTDGVYDEEYFRRRLEIGRVHESIELEPQWFFGAYGLYYRELLPRIQQHFDGSPDRASAACGALSRLFLLDMQVVLDAYYETRQRRAVEKSERLAAMGELAASVAHEVRNPLAGMKGALQVLRGELAVKPSNLEVVDELLAQIARLENLVRDLLSYARPRAVNLQVFDLHELLDRLLRLYKDQADAAGITVQRIYGPGTVSLPADPQQMEQVFINLIHNAIQAMEEGGTLTLATRAEDGMIVISFEDSGAGIPAGDLKRIFQPFFTTKHRGSGLGLPIVKQILDAHGGRIELVSGVSRGTAATVYLPVREVG